MMLSRRWIRLNRASGKRTSNTLTNSEDLQKMTKRLRWKSKESIPHHSELRSGGYKWVDDFLKVEGFYKQIGDKKTQLDQVKRAPRALTDVKKSLKASQARVAEQQKEALKAFIINFARHPDPLEQLRFESPDALLRLNINWPDDMLEAVFSELKSYWSPDAITDSTRKQRKKKLQDEITDLESDIAQYPDYPIWLEFVQSWRSLNSKVREGVDPQGFAITEKLRPGDYEAFQKLKLSEWVDSKSAVLPALAN
jgi:hypothetical protein